MAGQKADLDKDDQVSLLEAFLTASVRTAEFYEETSRLATEHALIDDNGDRRSSKPTPTTPDSRRSFSSLPFFMSVSIKMNNVLCLAPGYGRPPNSDNLKIQSIMSIPPRTMDMWFSYSADAILNRLERQVLRFGAINGPFAVEF